MRLSLSGQTRTLDDVMAYVPALRSFFARRSHRFDPDDLIQDLLLRVHQRRLRAPGEATVHNLEGYLYRVAANVLTDANRRSAVRGHHAAGELSDQHPGEEISADRVLEDKERLATVLAALRELPDKTRGMFVLVRFEGLSYSAVARRYGVSVSAIEKHVMRAVRHLSQRLQDVHADPDDDVRR